MHEQLGLGFGEADLLPFKRSKKRKLKRLQFHKDYRFFDHHDLTSCVEGKSNLAALTSLNQFLYSDQFPYRSFFLYGKSGVGKTKLMMASVRKYLKNKPNLTCKLFTGSDFTAEREASIEVNRKTEFLKETSETDFFILDDLHQLLLSKEALLDFIFVIEQLKQRGSKIFVLSPLSLSSIKRHSVALEKVFVSFLAERVEYIDPELAKTLFLSKVSELNILLSSEVIASISFNKVQTGYDIDRLIREIFRISLLESVDSLEVESLSKYKVIEPKICKDLEVEDALEAFSTQLNINVEDILSPSRKSSIAIDRHITMHYLNKVKGISLNRIARYFDRDHTVAIYAVRKIQSELDSSEGGKYFEKINSYKLFIKTL